MPRTKLSFQDNALEIKNFIKQLNRDMEEMPEEIQYIAKIKRKETTAVLNKVFEDSPPVRSGDGAGSNSRKINNSTKKSINSNKNNSITSKIT